MVDDGLFKKQMNFLKTLYDFCGLSELKMVHEKTRMDSLVGLEGFLVIIMYFTVHMHIL